MMNNCADWIVCQHTGVASKVVGVLRQPIALDLEICWNVNGLMLIDCIIPAATAIGTPVIFMTFTGSTSLNMDDVFSFSIGNSDGAIDPAGIASFTLFWS